jgi:hypothetical protein
MISTRWLCVAILATACKGDESDSSGGEPATETFSISGTVMDMGVPPLPGDIVTKSCTVSALDPSPAVSGGVPTVIATAPIQGDGSYRVEGIDVKPNLGLVLNVDLCPNDADVPTNTGVALETYQDLPDGGEITDKVIYRISAELGQNIDADLAKSGYEGKGIVPDGALLAFIVTEAKVPVDGATLECTGCKSDFFYFDNDRPDSGYFMTGGKMNTSTSIFTGGMVLVPAAKIWTYTASDGGKHEFEERTLGSQPGSVLISSFTGS